MVIQSTADEQNVNEVIQKYSDMIYRLAVANLRSRCDADDVYQDVFMRYIKEIKKGKVFESEEHTKAWFIRVTINCCKSLCTSAWFKRTQAIDETLPDEYDQFSDCGIDMHSALMQIPQKYRSLVHLYYFEQLSTEEIAVMTGEKSSTVRTQLSRARAMLREILKGDYLDE